MTKQDTLLGRIEEKRELTSREIDKCVKVLGSGCRWPTKRELRLVLGFVPDIRGHGIYGRVLFEDGRVDYCAGQSYPDEIRTVRNLLLGRRA
jgi:hypothetical protein